MVVVADWCGAGSPCWRNSQHYECRTRIGHILVVPDPAARRPEDLIAAGSEAFGCGHDLKVLAVGF